MTSSVLSMFKPAGDNKVNQLLADYSSSLEDLLDIETFPSEFRDSNNENLRNYMSYEKYSQLLDFITPNTKNPTQEFPVLASVKSENLKKIFKYPYVATEILSIINENTLNMFLAKGQIEVDNISIELVELDKENWSSQLYSRDSINSISSQDDTKDKRDDPPESFEETDNTTPEIYPLVSKSASEINEDDFPSLKNSKKFKEQKVIVSRTRVKVQPLLHRMMGFFDSEIQFTVDGYYCKIMQSFLNQKSREFIDFMLDYHYLDKLRTHAESKSIQQFIIKMITCNTEAVQQIAIAKVLKSYCNWLQSLRQKECTFSMERGISELLVELCNKLSKQTKVEHTRLKQILFNIGLFEELAKLPHQILQTLRVVPNDQRSFLLTESLKALSGYLKLQVSLKTSMKAQFPEDRYDSFIKPYIIAIFPNPYCRLCDKILVLQIVECLLDHSLGCCPRIIAEELSFIPLIYKLLQVHYNSSILQNKIMSIWEIVIRQVKDLNSSFTRLFNNLINESDLLSFLSKAISSKSNSLEAFVFGIFRLIHSIDNSLGQNLESIKNSKLWQELCQMDKTKKKNEDQCLGGFMKNQKRQTAIVSSKEQILQMNKPFLEGLKFSNFEEFDNYQVSSSDSQGEQRRQHRGGKLSVLDEEEQQEFYDLYGLQKPEKQEPVQSGK